MTASHLESSQSSTNSAIAKGEAPFVASMPERSPSPSKIESTTTSRSTLDEGTMLASLSRQLRWVLTLCFGLVLLSIPLFLYVYALLISNNPSLGPLLFSPSRTLLVVTILSEGLAILLRILFTGVFDALRWHLASRKHGVCVTTFLELSPATSSLGVLKLLFRTGLCNQAWWGIQKLLVPLLSVFVGVILKGDITFDSVYLPIETIPVLAGLAPINTLILAHIPITVAWIYISGYVSSILGNGRFVIGIEPVACRGIDCKSLFLPGSLELARGLDNLNGTSLNLNATLFTIAPVILVHNAPGYQLDFFPVEAEFTFDKTTECRVFGQASGDGLFMCVGSNSSTMIAGWSICPSNLYHTGQCFNDTSWMDSLQQSTSLSVFKRYATTAYDGRNHTILDLKYISAPEHSYISPVDFRNFFAGLLTPGPNITSIDTQSANVGLYYVGWGLRAFDDEYTSDSQLSLDLLRGLLTVYIQFSTMAWEWINASTVIMNTTQFALPSDLETTASINEVTYRAKAKPWTVWLFIGLTLILLIWCNSIVLWILVKKIAAPNLSGFVEVDIASKSSSSSIGTLDINSSEHEGDIAVEDFSTMLRRFGLENAESTAAVQKMKYRRIRVAGVEGGNKKNLILVTGGRASQELQNDESLDILRQGTVYG